MTDDGEVFAISRTASSIFSRDLVGKPQQRPLKRVSNFTRDPTVCRENDEPYRDDIACLIASQLFFGVKNFFPSPDDDVARDNVLLFDWRPKVGNIAG